MSVVSHATSSSARRGDHWSRTAQMRTDDLYCGITLQMAGRDQLHGGDGVLERCAHHPRDAVFADQRRASPVADWMQIQDAGVHRHADLAAIAASMWGIGVAANARTGPDVATRGRRIRR